MNDDMSKNDLNNLVLTLIQEESSFLNFLQTSQNSSFEFEAVETKLYNFEDSPQPKENSLKEELVEMIYLEKIEVMYAL